MTNDAVLIDKGIKCLTENLGILEAEHFIYVMLSQPFNDTEWRKKHLFADMPLDEISDAACKYCREHPADAG